MTYQYPTDKQIDTYLEDHAARVDDGRPPAWWTEDPESHRACACKGEGAKVRQTRMKRGRSDGAYVENECAACGRRWLRFFEG